MSYSGNFIKEDILRNVTVFIYLFI